MSSPHKCPVTGCEVQVPFTKLLCPRHWYMLHIDQQREIWREYRKNPQSKEHLLTCQRAVIELNERIATK